MPPTSPSRIAPAALVALLCLPAAAEIEGVPLNPRSKGAGETRFTALGPDRTGLAHVNRMQLDHPLSYLYHSGMTTGGVVVADFDGDGLPDLFFAGTTGPNRLYRQTGGLEFEDITATAGPIDGGEAWTAGAAAADVNGDGRVDLYTTSYMVPNQLFLNTGPGADGAPVTFREAAAEAGVDAVDCSHSAAFADYDGDGRLDMYLLTNRIENPDGTPLEMPVDRHADGSVSLKPGAEKYYHIWRWDAENWGTEAVGTPDRLYRNEGNKADGTPVFRDVSAAAGIAGRGDGLSVTWWDYDGDGWEDIYVGNDFLEPDKLYRNRGDGTFEDVIAQVAPHTPWFAMGADFGDVNNDLVPDLLVADMSATSHFKSKTTMGVMGGVELKRAYHSAPPQYMQNTLLIGTGTGRFLEGARLFGVSSTDWTWAVKFADFDNDGWQDVFFTNGISRHMNDSDHTITRDMLIGRHMWDYFKEGEMRREKNRAYRNTAGGRFAEASDAWGLGHTGVSYGAAHADLDRDGDLDLVVVNLEEPDLVFRNDSQEGNRLLVKLVGGGGNTAGLGAAVTVRTTAGAQMRQLQPQTGYHSCNEALIHFGLGDAGRVEELVVRWGPGAEERFNGLAANRFYTITRGEAAAPRAEPAREPRFAASAALAASKHKDAGWEEDFQKQSLLPFALAQLGPAIAWADVDGDGHDDYYFGGSAGQMGTLRLADGAGQFSAVWVEAFRADKAAEDQGAVFFDADGDGDPDLFVASGSSEFEPGAAALRDRLYLNDGEGGFTAAPEGAVPAALQFSSAVCAADYDRDGRPDLFVGARAVPGEWPLAGTSRLLRNVSSGGAVRFEPIELPGAGLVTGAIWSDADRDGWPDLMLATEWGPLRYFANDGAGKLADQTERAGLGAVLGWWRGLASLDADGDGDLDYAVTNIGLNTKYKQPSAKKPHITYFSDFDGTGKRKVVEVKREGDILYPERGRSCSSGAMPFIAEKFPTFKEFALAPLADIYEIEAAASDERFEANEFRSGIFINEGGTFRFQPLPFLAQIAPGNAPVACDLDGDGHTDLFLAQNFHGPQIETARFDGGLGQLLLGDGAGKFEPVPVREAGIEVPGDARAATVCDLDADGRPDLAVTVNSAPAAAFANRSPNRWLQVRAAPGSVVTLKREGAAPQVVEVAAGSGYLSQSAAVAWFGLGQSRAPGRVVVEGGGGTRTFEFDGEQASLDARP